MRQTYGGLNNPFGCRPTLIMEFPEGEPSATIHSHPCTWRRCACASSAVRRQPQPSQGVVAHGRHHRGDPNLGNCLWDAAGVALGGLR